MPLPLAKIQAVDDVTPDYDVFERLGAAYDLGKQDTFISNYLRNDYLDELEETTGKLKDFGVTSPEELNKTFTNVEKPFTKPTPYFVAQAIDEEAAETKRLQAIVSNNGRINGWGTSLLGGLAAHATDPVEFGADVLIGVATAGIGTYISKINQTKNSAKYALMASKLQEGTFTKSVVEGVVANTALEPHNYYSSKRAQKDYSANDAFISVMGGALAFPSFIHGGKYAMNKVGAQGAMLKANIKNFLDGKLPETGPIRKYYDKLLNEPSKAPADSIRANWKFKKFDELDMNEASFYVSAKNTEADLDIDTLDHNIYDMDFGDNVIHMIDDPNKAYNLAGDKFNESTGSVHSFKINPKNIINADDSIDSDVGKLILNSLDDELREVFDGSASIREGFEDIRKFLELKDEDLSRLNKLNDDLKAQGYDGYRYTFKNNFGEDSANGIALFKGLDNKKYEGSSKVDRKQVPDISEKDVAEYIQKMHSKESDIGHSTVLDQEVETAKKVPDVTDDDLLTNNMNELKNIEENLKKIDKKYLNEADKKFLDALEKTASDEATEAKMTQEYIDCLLKLGE